MTPYMAMIKVVTNLVSCSTKRRHKGGVHSNNTSSDSVLEVSISIGICQAFKKFSNKHAIAIAFLSFVITFESHHHKTSKVTSFLTLLSLIRVFAEPLGVAKHLSYLDVDSKDSDQTGWMLRLVQVFA